MGKICKVTVNDKSFFANCGDLLLDAALLNGVDMPHDCRSGLCGACRVNLVEGRVFGGQDDDEGTIHACQARIVSDIAVEVEDVPDTVAMSARVADLTPLAPDVTGVRIELPRPLDYLPGQYCKLQFRGFPERCYSPTFPLEGAPDDLLLHFHIRAVDDGLVSSALGDQIQIGHRVRVTGPLGAAYFRPGHPDRLIFVASGTGFAPMWSIAVAAIFERPKRELVFVVAARSLQSLYMNKALCRLAQFPNVTIIPVVSEPQRISDAIRSGRPTEHLPRLSPHDIIYTAGAPAMTQSVARLAKAVGAKCYTDPFVADTAPLQTSLVSRVSGWFGGSAAAGANAPAIRVHRRQPPQPASDPVMRSFAPAQPSRSAATRRA